MRTLLILAAVICAHAQPQPERVAWNRAPEALAGRFIRVDLTTGTRIGGTWLSVTPLTFSMGVEKTSNKHEIGTGLQTVPRSSIAQVRAGKRRVRGRIIGTVAGFYSLAAIAGLVGGHRDAFQGPIGYAAYAGAIAGFFIGRAYDHETRELILLPERSGGPE